jgi:hypothetical protein
MKADLSRSTYDRRKPYQMVLMQQGRVITDADWNEQVFSNWMHLCHLVRDIVGEHGGPVDAFKIKIQDEEGSTISNDFIITKGRYYVDGVMCKNDEDCLYTEQPHYPITKDSVIQQPGTYLVYLRVWLRHITHLKDPEIREVALGGPDTATRVQVVWQVKLKYISKPDKIDPDRLKDDYGYFEEQIIEEINPKPGYLKAWAKKDTESNEPCTIAPKARYRRAENQLYRVEIHTSGPAFRPNSNRWATFKWSRDNGSVVFPITDIEGKTITLAHLGKDESYRLTQGDWVEIRDEISELHDEPHDLQKVEAVDPDLLQVILSSAPDGPPKLIDENRKPRYRFLRRWNHRCNVDENGVIKVQEDETFTLEDGIQIEFVKPIQEGEEPPSENKETSNDDKYRYNRGDWWWISARTATGDVGGPRDEDQKPIARQADRAGLWFAPLALITVNDVGTISDPIHLRRPFNTIC